MQSKKIIEYIVNELRSYCENAGLEGFVVGVSGGIDSAVTSTLCALTTKNVIVLNMPILQAKTQDSLSSRHIEWLTSQFSNVRGIRVDLSSVFIALGSTLPSDIQDDLSMANARSRLRMVTLYAFAGHYKSLVAGTGNKVEDFGVGFYTKYGDGGVDISPIADLLKSEVYELGHELRILKEILQAPPTDGLWTDNRTDESQIGATYAELEWAMQLDDNTTNESLSDRQKEVLEIYRSFHESNLHKMNPIPVVKIPDELR